MKKTFSVLLALTLFLSVASAGSLENFSDVDLSGPSSAGIQTKYSGVIHRGDTFIGKASSAFSEGYGTHAVGFRDEGEVKWQNNLSKRGEDLIKLGKVFEEKYIGVVYNESLEVLTTEGERIREFDLERREFDEQDLRYLKAGFREESLYVATTESCCDGGYDFRLTKIGEDSEILWSKSLKAARSPDGPYTPRVTSIETTDEGLVLTGEGEPARNRTERPDNLPEWGNYPETDYDWKIFSVDENGIVNWNRTETSGKGKDTPVKIDVSDEELEVSGTFSEQNDDFRHAVYDLETGEILDEKILEFNGSGRFYDSFTDVQSKLFGEDYSKEYYIYTEVQPGEKKVREAAFDAEKLEEKAFDVLPENKNVSRHSLQFMSTVNTGNSSYIVANIRNRGGTEKTSIIAEVELEEKDQKLEELREQEEKRDDEGEEDSGQSGTEENSSQNNESTEEVDEMNSTFLEALLGFFQNVF
jgi:hypothetical protein